MQCRNSLTDGAAIAHRNAYFWPVLNSIGLKYCIVHKHITLDTLTYYFMRRCIDLILYQNSQIYFYCYIIHWHAIPVCFFEAVFEADFSMGLWRPPKECTYECSQPSLLLLCRNQFLTGQTGFINAKTSFTSLKLVLPVRHQQTYSISISWLVGAWNEHHSKTSF